MDEVPSAHRPCQKCVAWTQVLNTWRSATYTHRNWPNLRTVNLQKRNGGLWVWNYQFLCFQREALLQAAQPLEISTCQALLVECLYQSSSLRRTTRLHFFSRPYCKLVPSKYGISTTHQQVPDEPRWSLSSLQALTGMMQHKDNYVLRQTSKIPQTQRTVARLTYMHGENVPNCPTIW